MATSYLGLLAGRFTEMLAGLTGGAGDANKIPALDSSGRLPLGMMPTGVGPDVAVLTASEAIAANAFVNVNRTTGAVRNASAGGIGTRADGYVLASVTSGQPAQVFFDDNNSGFTNLPLGDYWLDTVAGKATQTPPTGAGVVSQRLGVGVSATTIHVNIQEPVVLAQ